MPILKFIALLGTIAIVWIGLVDIFYKYGAIVGMLALLITVMFGRYLSKITLAKIRSKQ